MDVGSGDRRDNDLGPGRLVMDRPVEVVTLAPKVSYPLEQLALALGIAQWLARGPLILIEPPADGDDR